MKMESYKNLLKLAPLTLVFACGSHPQDRLPAASTTNTICGTSNDLQQVDEYDGTLGVSKSFVATHQAPVGIMRDAEQQGYCSGTLIADDLFLTAGHCVYGSDVSQDFVAFNYHKGVDEAVPYAVAEVVEDNLNGLDFAIVRLEDSPGSRFGTATLNPQHKFTKDETIAIIQHPAGETKQVDAGTYAGSDSTYLSYKELDTLGGSSGSGVLNASGEVVGVHTNGGCYSSGGANRGVLLSEIAAASATIKDLLGL